MTNCFLHVLDDIQYFFFFNDTAPTEIYTLSLHERSSDLFSGEATTCFACPRSTAGSGSRSTRSEEHTSELQSPYDLVCRLLLEKKKITRTATLGTSLQQIETI